VGLDTYDGATYGTNDPLRVYQPLGPSRYEAWSVRAAVARVGGVQAYSLAPRNAPLPEDDEMALTAEERASLEMLRALSWGTDSITNAINRIGALEEVQRQNEVVLAEQAGMSIERERQIMNLEAEVRSLHEQEGASGLARLLVESFKVRWGDGVEQLYPVTRPQTQPETRAATRKRSAK
jgi:hypothetical protein